MDLKTARVCAIAAVALAIPACALVFVLACGAVAHIGAQLANLEGFRLGLAIGRMLLRIAVAGISGLGAFFCAMAAPLLYDTIRNCLAEE